MYKARLEKLVATYNRVTRSNARVVMDAGAPCGYHLMHGTPTPGGVTGFGGGAAGHHHYHHHKAGAAVNDSSFMSAPPTPQASGTASAAHNFFQTPPEFRGIGKVGAA